MKVFILGSCVTRDIFRVVNKEIVSDYYARTNLISLMSQPLPIVDINLESEFQKKIIRRDFEKDFFVTLKKTDFDYLIIDLIDERFNILKYHDSYITKSNEFVNANLECIYNFEQIDKTTKEYQESWVKSAIAFVDKLQSIVPSEKIIIHEAYWSEKYIAQGKITSFDYQKMIRINNKLLHGYYQYIKNLIPTKILKVESPIADINHIWGLSPFHYTDDYYYEIYDQLKQVF